MKRLKIGQPVEVSYSHWGDPEQGYVVRRTKFFDVVVGDTTYNIPTNEDHRASEGCTITPLDKPLVQVMSARRSDGYWHYAVVVGRRVIIAAGCRDFSSTARATKHWTNRRRYQSVVPYYPTAKARRERERDAKLNKFSLAFVRKVERLRTKKK